jgi:hypothetical protein
MRHYTVRHTIETDVDSFWKLFLDPEYNQGLFESCKEFLSCELLEERLEENGVLNRRVSYAPVMGLPAAVRKMMGEAGSFVEVGHFDPSSRKYVAKWLPSGTKKFWTDLQTWAEPLGDRRCERVMDVQCTVNIPGFGSTIEALVEQTQRQALTQMAEFMNGWIRERALVQQDRSNALQAAPT